MATNWMLVEATQVQRFMSAALVGATSALNPDDAQGDARLTGVIESVVARVRGAAGSSNRIPLSLTPGTVPPEAHQHTLILICAAMLASTPQIGDYAESKLFTKQYEMAEKWLDEADDGRNFTPPTDPDPTTVSVGPAWGNLYGTATGANDDDLNPDLTTI